MMKDNDMKYEQITQLTLTLADRDKRIIKLKETVEKYSKVLKTEEKEKNDMARTNQDALEETQVIELKAEVERLEEDMEKNLEEIESNLLQEIEGTQTTKEREVESLENEIEHNKKELELLNEYKKNKDEKDSYISRLQKKYDTLNRSLQEL